MTRDPLEVFLDRWSHSGGAEHANYQLFLGELCDILAVPRPNPTVPDDDQNAYVFERQVIFQNPDGTRSYGRIDLYNRGRFVLETKQSVEKEDDEPVLSTAGQERQAKRKKGHGTRGTSAWNDTLLRARGQALLDRRSTQGRSGASQLQTLSRLIELLKYAARQQFGYICIVTSIVH